MILTANEATSTYAENLAWNDRDTIVEEGRSQEQESYWNLDKL